MIASSLIEEIRKAADIVSIISEYVRLKKTGKNFVGLCPFHSERTPSFTVSPEKGLYHCFGCGEGGNIFSFLMKIENIDFIEAVSEVGRRVGISIKEFPQRGVPSTEKEKIYEAIALSSAFYEQNLYNEEIGKSARDYLKRREIDEGTSKIFRLGYSPASWDSLSRFLIGRGVSPPLLEKAGLALKREEGIGFYDRFRNRLMFPICDSRGRAIGFGGRSITSEDPKYINSPDSSVYIKGDNIYGLNLTKDEIKKSGAMILVEGNIDLITCYQADIKNAGCSLGTALTLNQGKLIGRYSNNIILAFDSDSAGESATERSIELLKSLDLNVKIAALEEKDPDEFIRKRGKEAFLKAIQSAKPWMLYKIESISKRFNIDEVEGRAKALKEAISCLSKEEDPFIQEEYIKTVSELLKIDVERVSGEIKREKYYKGAKLGAQLKRVTEKPPSKVFQAEQNILKLASEDINILNLLREKLEPGEFTDKYHRIIAEFLINVAAPSQKDVAHAALENLPDEEAKKVLSKILISDMPPSPEASQDYINTIKANNLKLKLEELRNKIIEAEKSKDFERVNALSQEYLRLKFS